MRAFLVWDDGRRELTTAYGGRYVFTIRPGLTRGTYMMHTFEITAAGPGPNDPWIYTWVSAKDVTDDMERADRENNERTWGYLRRGWERPPLWKRILRVFWPDA